MSKHTPEPWKVFNAWQDHRDQSIQFTRIGNDETTILHAEDTQVEIVVPNEADLHLIAAAPELLQALVLIDETFVADCIATNAGVDLEYAAKLRNIARAVIAKAKGE